MSAKNLPAGLFSLLTSDASVAALIGTRVYPMLIEEGATLPAIRYQFVGGSTMPTLDTSGMQRARVQVDCYGDTYDDASSLRAAVIGALNGYQGTLADGTDLRNVVLINPGLDFYESDSRQFVCMCEFYLFYSL